EKWGGKKSGLFQKPKIEEVIQKGIREFPGVFADCVKALVTYQLDKNKKALAERWLLGEDLQPEELSELGINSVVEEDDVCLAMVCLERLLKENSLKYLKGYITKLKV
ncbi:MAG: hypothetical protein ACTSSC_07130, partial [Promethearchaeota archaeon]